MREVGRWEGREWFKVDRPSSLKCSVLRQVPLIVYTVAGKENYIKKTKFMEDHCFH